MKKALLLLSLIFLTPTKASAQEISVGVDPAIIQINTEAPSLVKSPLSVINNSDQNITYSIFLVPFKPDSDGNGQPDFDINLKEEYKDIFKKVQISDENQDLTQIDLAPKQRKDLTLSIRLPQDEKPKDYYFSVIFVSENIDEKNNQSIVGARAGIGANVLLSIGPKSPTEGEISYFKAKKFVTKGPVNFDVNIYNKSNHYITPEGNLVIKNIFGQTVGNINLEPVNILANSSRLMKSKESSSDSPKVVWNEKFLFGVYKTELNIALSDEGPLLKQTKTFFAFPLELILGSLVALVLTLGIIKRARAKNND